MNYIVTGSAGFIGSHLAEYLITNGHNVLGIDNLNSYYSEEVKLRNIDRVSNLGGSFKFEKREIESLTKDDLVSADGIFHLAAQAGVRDSWGLSFSSYAKNNILATQHIFELAKDGIPIIYASSSSVYGNASNYPVYEHDHMHPVSPYGVTKASCDLLAQAYQKSYESTLIGIRYFTVYGPGQRPDMAFTRICSAMLDNSEFTVMGTGSQIRDFTYVHDAIRATVALMESKTAGVYNVGGGNEISLNDAIELFQQVSGKKLRTRKAGSAIGDVSRTGASIEKINKITGWKPEYNVIQGVQNHWRWAHDNSEMVIKAVNDFYNK